MAKRKGICKHFCGVQTPCKEEIDIRELVGGDDSGWMARIPCIMSMDKRRLDNFVRCNKFIEPTEQEIKLSEAQITLVISTLDSASKISKREGWRGEKRAARMRELTEDFLRQTSGGMWIDVCHQCLGTGLNNHEKPASQKTTNL